MAGCAISREKICKMVRVCGTVEIGLMTIDAIVWKTGKPIVFVALRTWDSSMRTDQGERSECMIKTTAPPRRSDLVALNTIR
jgi:hypothetical protein